MAENGQLQGALDFYGIKYTGSGVLGSALGLDNSARSWFGNKTGVPTPPFEVVMRGDDYEAAAQKIVPEARVAAVREAGERRIDQRRRQGSALFTLSRRRSILRSPASRTAATRAFGTIFCAAAS